MSGSGQVQTPKSLEQTSCSGLFLLQKRTRCVIGPTKVVSCHAPSRYQRFDSPALRDSSCGGLPELGARGKLHLKGRALPERRFDPNASTVHLDDLLGDGKSKARAAFGLGVGTVDLMELLENPRLMLLGNAWSCISHADVELAIVRLGGHTHLACVGKLDGIAHEVEQHLGESLLVAETNR